jgi:hypothetical protein
VLRVQCIPGLSRHHKSVKWCCEDTAVLLPGQRHIWHGLAQLKIGMEACSKRREIYHHQPAHGGDIVGAKIVTSRSRRT